MAKYTIVCSIFVMISYHQIQITDAKHIKTGIYARNPGTLTLPISKFPQTYRKVHQERLSETVQKTQHVFKRQGEGSEQVEDDVLQSTFDAGFRRLFKFLINRFSVEPQEGKDAVQQEEVKYKLPGLPTTSIFHSYDLSSIIKLLETDDNSQIEILAEAAIVDTISQLVAVIGFNDLRDWFGMIVMYFILGPIMIPLFWLPISLLGMTGLMVPLFYFNPPSKLNNNVMGHDPIAPENVAGGGARRSLPDLSTSSNIPEQATTVSTVENITIAEPNIQSLLSPASGSIFEGCMERLHCQFTGMYRDNPISKWFTSRLNVTKVEWAREKQQEDSNREDCRKYSCSILPAVRSLISPWNNADNQNQ